MNIHFRFRVRWAWVAAFALVSCSNDYNPFTDLSKARAVVTHKSFNDVDTLNIFTTETLVVRVANCELVDSFSITAPSNRRLADTFTVRKHQPLESGPYTYLLSLTDTGWKTITVTTYRNNGDRVPQEFFLYLRSPLGQPPLSGAFGDSVALSTTPVGDTDVAYHWGFGGGFVVSSSKPKTVASVKMSSLSNAGSLWVSDPSGAHPSPAVPFTYALKDTTGPIIKCVSAGYVGKDTIVTGDTTFYFKVQIWDPAQTGAVQSASVNGRSFDIDDDPFYICVLTRLDTNVRLFPVTVSAVNNPQFLVSSTKTFWFQFSSTMAHGGGVLFSVTDPSTDTSVTSSRSKVIFGHIEDYVHDSILVIVKLWENNAKNSLADTVRGKGKADWSFSLPLAIGSNMVRLAAYCRERRFNRRKIAPDRLRHRPERQHAAGDRRYHGERRARCKQICHRLHGRAPDHRLRRRVGHRLPSCQQAAACPERPGQRVHLVRHRKRGAPPGRQRLRHHCG